MDQDAGKNTGDVTIHLPVKCEAPQMNGAVKPVSGYITPDDCSTPDVDDASDLLYGLEDVPPWHLSLLLGFQQYLTYCGALLANIVFLLPLLCIGVTNSARALILSTAAFTSGIATLLQATYGSRLPILQGPGIIAIIPLIIHLESPKWQCPDVGNHTISNGQVQDDDEVWQSRMREIQGAIIIAGAFETIFALTGLVTLLLRVITPLVLMPVMTLIGLSMFENASRICSGSWATALGTAALFVIFSEVLSNPKLFCCKKEFSGFRGKCIIFCKLYSVLLSISIMWTICAVLTHYDLIPENSRISTTHKMAILDEAPWFRLPYPGQWGNPTFSAAAVFGMLGAVLASVIDSIGDYYACAKVSGAPPPPEHAFNRGIFMEGVASVFSGIMGSGFTCVSYTGPIGVIGITKVGSRRIAQIAAIYMLAFGIICKFGAFFVMIPEPILGGIFLIVFGSMVTIGLSYLDTVKIRSKRNLIVIGVPLFFGLAFPKWIVKNKSAIDTGYEDLDSMLTLFLSTSMFVGGFLAFILDNIIPGTDEERGILKANIVTGQVDKMQKPFANAQECYDLPIITEFLRKWNISRFIPISPTYIPGTFSLRTWRNKTISETPAEMT